MHDPLEAVGAREALAKKILEDIDAYCVNKMKDGHRHHLGASLIGEECSRKLWYIFRWVHAEQFTGQQLRLFNRGHLEEFRLVEWLRGIGATVQEYQEDGVTQLRINGVDGHYGGSLDGQLMLPTNYGSLPIFLGDMLEDVLLAEFKTSNDKGFKELQKKKSVAVCKPLHFAQMSTYGAAYKFKYAVYMMINKNDDHIYIEIVKLDWAIGSECLRKAEDIIRAKVAPPKMSQDPTFFKCKSFCSFTSICHYGAPVERNCRSCAQAEPKPEAQWWCNHFGSIIPKDFLKNGCDSHMPIV
jgi:hypothetical protein